MTDTLRPVHVIGGGLAGSEAAWALAKSERQSLNVEGARQHVLTDLYASLAAATTAVGRSGPERSALPASTPCSTWENAAS